MALSQQEARIAAQIAKAEAEAERAKAEAAKFRAEAEQAEHSAVVSRINREQAERRYLEEKTGDKYHHVYWFTGAVDAASVKACMSALDMWDRLEPGCDVEIVFISPGGSVISGMALFDHILNFRVRGHKVKTVARGYAASMAGILLQAGDKRVMGREAYLLIHEVSSLAVGSMGQIEDEVEFLKKIQGRILDIFAKRSKLSKATIRRRWRRKDWWLSSEEALRFGFVDKVE